MTLRVLLADDEPLVRSGIAMLLAAESDIEVVGEASSGEQAIELSRATRPEVVVMDVRMPGIGGVEATRRLVAQDAGLDHPPEPGPAVLILTTYNLDEAVYAALRAGAAGFLLKHAAPADLAAAVRALAKGEGWLDPAVTRALIEEFAARPETAAPTPEELRSLTKREREVLVLVAHGMSNCEIADHLVVGEGTVKTHVGRILMKLGVRGRAQVVAAAYQSGLVRPGDAVPSRAPTAPSG